MLKQLTEEEKEYLRHAIEEIHLFISSAVEAGVHAAKSPTPAGRQAVKAKGAREGASRIVEAIEQLRSFVSQ